MDNINILFGDRLELTVNFDEINASIVLSIDFVERTVKWGGAAVLESLLGEILIRLKLKKRRYYPLGERIIPPGVKGLEITEAFYRKLETVLSTAVRCGVINGTLRVVEEKGEVDANDIVG